MKTITFIIAIYGMTMGQMAFAQGINFEKGSWQKILEKSRSSNKIIFVDFYATWCGPCKYMSKEVFTSKEAGAYFNDNFISFKVDAEKHETELVNSIALEAYPTLGFFSPQGKLIYKHVGGLEVEPFIELGKKVRAYTTSRARVLKNEATREEILAYLSIAQVADSLHYNEIAPEIALTLTQQDLDTEDGWRLFTSEVSDINSPVFQAVVEKSAYFFEKYENFVQYIDGVLSRHLTKMVEEGNIQGLDIHKSTLQTLYREVIKDPHDYLYFDLKANANYHLQRGELEDFASNLIKWVDTYFSNDSEQLLENAIALASRTQNENTRKKALEWALKAIELDRNKHSLYSLAIVYENIGEKQKAIETATGILELDLDDEEDAFIREFLEELNG